MDELVVWLRAQLDEDERTALAAAEPEEWVELNRAPQLSWSVELWADPDCAAVVAEESSAYPVVVTTQGMSDADAEARVAHIARHDPARVLREIDAKRQMIDELSPAPQTQETDEELHARCAHPAYEYATTEGPRKQWDGADVPPADANGDPDPTWERNVDAGRDGWERWDYTEESYWRRRLPAGQERQPHISRALRLLALPYADRPGYKESWRP